MKRALGFLALALVAGLGMGVGRAATADLLHDDPPPADIGKAFGQVRYVLHDEQGPLCIYESTTLVGGTHRTFIAHRIEPGECQRYFVCGDEVDPSGRDMPLPGYVCAPDGYFR